jgi:signal transduction histidine kinase/phage shock protein PspC (stress-responsive transcriptional regulator)
VEGEQVAEARPRRLVRRPDGAWFGGVATGLAEYFGLPLVAVRLAFVALAVAGGTGVVLYGAAWVIVPEADPARDGPGPVPARGRNEGLVQTAALVLVVVGVLWILAAAGLLVYDAIVLPLAIAAAGVVLVVSGGDPPAVVETPLPDAAWLRRLPPAARELLATLYGTRRGTRLRIALGAVLVVVGLAAFLAATDLFVALSGALAAAIVVGAGVVLVLGPWLWQLASRVVGERRERIRSEERAEMAAVLHDSVLQTLAMVQRHADAPATVRSLARRQERELRVWLSGGDPFRSPASLRAAVEALADEVEAETGIPVEVVVVGDEGVDDATASLLASVREAARNAAVHSGASTVSIYVEVGVRGIDAFVRDTGCGFERSAVPGDRRGLTESIVGRMTRLGGHAVVRTAPGEGTEIELHLPAGDRGAVQERHEEAAET